MALDTPSSTPTSPMTSSVTSMTSGVSAAEVSFRQLVEMWHPHVYATPPKSPTPFSIDDILKRRQPQMTMTSSGINPSVASEMADSLKKLLPALQQPAGWAHLINNLLLQQQHHHSTSVS